MERITIEFPFFVYLYIIIDLLKIERKTIDEEKLLYDIIFYFFVFVLVLKLTLKKEYTT